MFYIIGRSDCKWCDKAKELLREKGLDYISQNYDSFKPLKLFLKDWGLTTVPQIWEETIDGAPYHIGGFSELKEYLNDDESGSTPVN